MHRKGTFSEWSNKNHLFLNSIKTKEEVVDFCRSRTQLKPVCIRGEAIKVVQSFKYLGV